MSCLQLSDRHINTSKHDIFRLLKKIMYEHANFMRTEDQSPCAPRTMNQNLSVESGLAVRPCRTGGLLGTKKVRKRRGKTRFFFVSLQSDG